MNPVAGTLQRVNKTRGGKAERIETAAPEVIASHRAIHAKERKLSTKRAVTGSVLDARVKGMTEKIRTNVERHPCSEDIEEVIQRYGQE